MPNNTPLIAKASLSSIRVTPQKARRVVNMIRGQRADEALRIAKFSPQVAVSEDLYSLLNSAVANAKQKNPAIRDASELWVTEALVDEGITMKRYRPRAQGRGYQILKRSSQISVTLSDDKNYRPISKAEARKRAKAAAEAAAAEAVVESAKPKKSAAKKAAAKEEEAN
ncbi:MAG: 50S ribosomal protein L22 [Actinobacteria bacterium]|nr:50S ribosomal protein L22 [Actinomycetota bacterium]NCZ73060.1 50S ribosomal protein L22 [Actinomycetota bacterium]NDA41111.1 50S ribosomal protein L22 [Actinomycetota bacterium]NDB30963.1 50S ribosomal protein L22 [Actinomycetota bacterium]NDD59985.1 50S ribosomal protein L22 [Actinomycetota bacterium]